MLPDLVSFFIFSFHHLLLPLLFFFFLPRSVRWSFSAARCLDVPVCCRFLVSRLVAPAPALICLCVPLVHFTPLRPWVRLPLLLPVFPLAQIKASSFCCWFDLRSSPGIAFEPWISWTNWGAPTPGQRPGVGPMPRRCPHATARLHSQVFRG